MFGLLFLPFKLLGVVLKIVFGVVGLVFRVLFSGVGLVFGLLAAVFCLVLLPLLPFALSDWDSGWSCARAVRAAPCTWRSRSWGRLRRRPQTPSASPE